VREQRRRPTPEGRGGRCASFQRDTAVEQHHGNEGWGGGRGTSGVPGIRSSRVLVPPARRCEGWERGLTGGKTWWWGATASWWVGWMERMNGMFEDSIATVDTIMICVT
jgi:hypothetical protein